MMYILILLLLTPEYLLISFYIYLDMYVYRYMFVLQSKTEVNCDRLAVGVPANPSAQAVHPAVSRKVSVDMYYSIVSSYMLIVFCVIGIGWWSYPHMHWRCTEHKLSDNCQLSLS